MGWSADHYYSPIPDYAEVQRQIDLNHAGQASLLEEFAGYQSELPFLEEKSEGLRYFHNNEWFTYADAIFLRCLLRKHQPQRRRQHLPASALSPGPRSFFKSSLAADMG